MKNSLFLLAILTGLSLSATVSAASFDCKKATTKVEKLICDNSELSKLDSELAETYKEAVRKDPTVRADQSQWLKQRNTCTDAKCLNAQYKERINDLDDFIVRYNRSIANKDSIDKNIAEGLEAQKANQSLNVLFQSGGAWVADESITRSNLSCSALLANSTLGLAFEKYEANQMTVQIRVGGRHPNKNNPEVQRMLTSDIRIPIRVENVRVGGNKVTFDRISTNRQGAVMGETYELDTGNKVIRMLKAHTCQNCGEAELRSFRNRQSGGSMPKYWCNG
jgi:uncharacterized protein